MACRSQRLLVPRPRPREQAQYAAGGGLEALSDYALRMEALGMRAQIDSFKEELAAFRVSMAQEAARIVQHSVIVCVRWAARPERGRASLRG